ncbi:MAG TPA: MurR/RpiR family transcriptional regulator, partial [Kofleriaceae bacterium]|nr:MurR/RpiR family transcriptional regulator [Kofleriaceae bacterium]
MASRPPRLETPADLAALVRARSASLPPQQRAVADLLVERLDESPFFSVPTLAERAGVSEATVVRVAQRLGFSGFPELKAALLELVRARLAGGSPAPAHAGTDALSAVTRLEADNLDRLQRGLDRTTFEAAAAALSSADHVFTFGAGLSAHLAELAAYLLVQAGVRTSALSVRFTSPSEQIIMLRPDDALIALSLPPYSRPTLDLLAAAAERAIPTVVITDKLTAPASSIARHALAVPTHNVLFTNALAAVVALINALGVEIARQRGGDGLRALSELNRILAADPDGAPAPPARPRSPG